MILLALFALSGMQQDTTRTVTWGAFIDTYYAWDFNRPSNLDRSFTTQPARHNEFNVNLAHVEVKLSGPRLRGRLALQAGTSVQSNYAGEPRVGTISGPDLARNIQEGVIGVRAGRKVWIDAGVYLSHIGQESWISRDNPTYTRSLIADYSPYYETGVKATWAASGKLTAQLHVLNGWQNISETNTSKALGMRLDYAASPHVALGYSNFIGNEAPDTVPSRLRVFNEVFAFVTRDPINVWVTIDYGTQRRAPAAGSSRWWGAAAIARIKLNPTVSLSGRLERYEDPDGVIVTTATPNPFNVSSGSLGIDVAPFPGTLWRTEVRGYTARDAIFPMHGSSGFTTHDGVVVSSLALTL
jgi:hypothetical protein